MRCWGRGLRGNSSAPATHPVGRGLALVRLDAPCLAAGAPHPAAVVVPYCMGGGTDAKAFAPLGISCFGFAPLGADPEGRTVDGVHGVDERVPVASVRSGQLILQDFLENV